MSSVEFLREFINRRLTAAAEEIFGVFQKAIVEYEEEILRQRRLLDAVCKPEMRLPATGEHILNIYCNHLIDVKHQYSFSACLFYCCSTRI